MGKYKYNHIKYILPFALCSLLFVIVGCAKKEIKNLDSRGKNIICFGDSITFGYGAEPGQDFPRFLQEMINIPVINSGLDGDDTNTALKRLKIDILNRKPLLVIIEFGGNDFLRKIPLKDTLGNIEEMIKEIQSVGAMVALADISLALVMDDYRKGFMYLCHKYNAIYIPQLLKGIITNLSLRSDFIHPNAEGYKVIAQRIYRYIIPHLNRNATLRKIK